MAFQTDFLRAALIWLRERTRKGQGLAGGGGICRQIFTGLNQMLSQSFLKVCQNKVFRNLSRRMELLDFYFFFFSRYTRREKLAGAVSNFLMGKTVLDAGIFAV